MVRALGRQLVRVSRGWVRFAVAGSALGLTACAYQLSGLEPGSDAGAGTASGTRDTDTSTETSEQTGGTSLSSSGEGGATDVTSETPSPCDNQQLDEGETAIDCGGDQCQPCGFGLPCLENDDCQSGLCNETCLAMGCQNGEQDGTETDRDCGGDCEPCLDDAGCVRPSDCQSGVCDGETCQAPTCTDGVKNGDEADEDCGTEDCGLCPDGASCEQDEQCVQGTCKDLICADPQCTDLRTNGDETDTDCGGSCPPCAADAICLDADDCESRVCLQTSATTNRCAEANCQDEVQNGQETDIDCGGGMGCAPCPDGDSCVMASDCQSSVCDAVSSSCSVPACTDEVRNGVEVGIDCGGECSGCPDGTPCSQDSECGSGSCEDDVCVAATCDDGRMNQDESDVDCGGSCAGCGFGLECQSDDDCLSSDCDQTCQRGGVNAACAAATDCFSSLCTDERCAPGYRGAGCGSDADCQSGYCKSDDTCGSGDLGAPCEQPSDCASNLCSNSLCAASRFVVRTDGGSDSAVVNHRTQFQANASDPSRAWQDIALVYFFSVVAPETHVNYQSRYYQGPNLTTKDDRFLAFNPTGTDWMLVWRALAGNTTAVPTGALTAIELQLRDNPWAAFNFSNDYSYRTGGYADNAKVVVCQRVDGRWVHTQGTPPPSIPEPCALVVDTCEDSTVACDVLERAD